MLKFTLRIVEIQIETNDTITICFKQPGLKKIKYSAGQYLTLIFRINNRIYHRPYSFSSAPGIDPTLNVTIKKVPGGIISNYVADFLKIDDVLEVLEPIGDFTLENKNISDSSSLVFWGAGSGVTPLFSMIKYALKNNIARHITLVYGNRNQESTIFHQAINELQKQYPVNFTVLHFHSKFAENKTSPAIISGRIDVQKVIETVKETSEINNTYHYICGPNGLSDLVRNTLQANDILQDHVFCESFELRINPKVFEGIATQTVLIKKAEQEYCVEVVKGKTILEAGLDAMIDLSYSCQTGTCLLCKAQLISGELKSVLTSSDTQLLDKDEYLLCCSLPLTNNIKLLVS